MLVVKVYVTSRKPDSVTGIDKMRLTKIDEIHIQNVGEIVEGIYKYVIKKPKGIEATITHARSEGYRPLLERALGLLEHKGKKSYIRRKKR